MKNIKTGLLKGFQTLSTVIFYSLAIGLFLIPLANANATTLASVGITASPGNISCGQSTQLNWSSTDATTVTISPSIGAVTPYGQQNVSPTQTTSYTITGSNDDGGYGVASVTVNVSGSCGGTPTPQVCQDPSATNYGGALPCTYPTQTCQDPSANNYGGQLPCTYPPQVCRDPSATNYGGALPCNYYTAQVCRDTTATNFGGSLPCIYPIVQQVCRDTTATNYGGTLPCNYYNYIPQVCRDTTATNYGGTLPCNYYNNYTQVCRDTTATNYGSTGSCIYQQIYNNYNNYVLPTVTVYATPASVSYNGATTVHWTTANATSCYASGGSVGWAGVKSIGPGSFYTGSLTSSKIYSLNCTNSFGSTNASATVNVSGQTIVNTSSVVYRAAPTSLVLLSSSVDRNQPIVPTLDNTRPHPGDYINYNVTYQNIGTASITNLILQIGLPLQVDYISSNPINPNISGNVLVFSLGTLKANGQGSVSVKVRVRDDAAPGTILDFPATLSYINPAGQQQAVNADVSAQVWGQPLSTLGSSVFGSGIFFPSSLAGWLLLLILILIMIYLIKYLATGETLPFKKRTTTTTIQH